MYSRGGLLEGILEGFSMGTSLVTTGVWGYLISWKHVTGILSPQQYVLSRVEYVLRFFGAEGTAL